MPHSPSRSAVTAFAAEPTSATAARRFVRQTLLDAGISQAICDRAELIVSELVTNAVLHAGTGPIVSVRVANDSVRIDVEDTSPAAPVLREYGLDASTGRGMHVVGTAAHEWGVETTSSGKSVWATLLMSEALPSTDEPDPLFTAKKEIIDENRQPDALADLARTNKVLVTFADAPTDLYMALERHNESLVREFSLLAIQNRIEPSELSDDLREAIEMFNLINVRATGLRSEARAAEHEGRPSFSMSAEFDETGVEHARRFAKWADLADRLSEANLLLTPPASAQLRALRRWFVEETIDQVEHGKNASAWTDENTSKHLSNRNTEVRIVP